MPTTNVNIQAAWVKVADAADDPFLISVAGAGRRQWHEERAIPGFLEIATVTAAAAAPAATLDGHVLGAGEAVTRDLVGAGDVYARTQLGVTLPLVVTK